WQDLPDRGRVRAGRISTTHIPPGPHMIEIRALGRDGEKYDTAEDLSVPSGTTKIGWSESFSGAIRGDIARHNDVVVVASTGGAVRSYRPSANDPGLVWENSVGPVYRGPIFSPDGEQILVPGADHRLYSLDAGDGSVRWETDLGAPVMGEIAIAESAGRNRAYVVADTELACVALDGAIQWRASLDGPSRARPVCDGDRVFVGSGDGRMYAFDARTGEKIWSVELTGRNTEYGRLLYGPWASHARLLPDDGLLVSTFSDLRSLDRVTGDERWVSAEDTLSGQVSYTPPAVTEFGIVAFDGGTGDAHLLDVESGELLWHSPALSENRGPAPGPVEG